MAAEHLNRARARKNDEFYTILEDIEKELDPQEHLYENKTVYCNCDTAASAFTRYFTDKWKKGIISRLIVSGLEPETREPYYSDTADPFGIINNGAFSSRDACRLLAQADIVITNPPFSRFIEYIRLLRTYEKDYIIIIPVSHICRHLLKDAYSGGASYGINFIDYFHTADGKKNQTSHWLYSAPPRGKKPLIPSARLREHDYKYDSKTGALFVPSKALLPGDYPGLMAVPGSTFADMVPEQYEFYKIGRPWVDGVKQFDKIYIKWRAPYGKNIQGSGGADAGGPGGLPVLFAEL